MLDGEGRFVKNIEQVARQIQQRLHVVLRVSLVSNQRVLLVPHILDGPAHHVDGRDVLLVALVEAGVGGLPAALEARPD